MAAKVISFGIQKGGAAKTTSSGITAYLLSQLSHRVLVVDMDSQGNITELLTQQDIYSFHGKTVLEALKDRDASKYIHRVTDNLHLMTAEDLLATFPRYLYTEYKGNKSLVLRETLESVREDYDYIIIDTPPALGDQTINALSASDAVVIMFESSKFCYSALERFIETVGHVKEMVNPDLKIAGILRTIVDVRRSDAKAFVELIEEEYPDMAFETVITRKAQTGRLTIHGFKDNPELKLAVQQYQDFIKELIDRV
ncbi:ParA family protein [Brevibacillus laterosporus]|uniref:ParA family protein n=1 Tax=Brevibacillus laterosporus TaxID=1465 RepID=UPI0014447424|nr:ParA family protein [Brevibacillus laterosporus]NKQ22778.1 ParA family protein [Brevibacillus laterosporus]WNX33772.1 ParA family protein [Brevibacillus laterosporus]